MNLNFYSFNVTDRKLFGKYNNFKLRSSGKIPGVIYGIDFLRHFYIDANNVSFLIKSIKNGANVFKCNFDDDNFFVIVKNIQNHPYKPEYLHIDLQRVNLDTFVLVDVIFKFVGFENCIGLKNGGVFVKHISSVIIKCKVLDIPEFIFLDISNLNINQTIFLNDLNLSDKFFIPSLNHKSKISIASILGSRVLEDKVVKDEKNEKDKIDTSVKDLSKDKLNIKNKVKDK